MAFDQNAPDSTDSMIVDQNAPDSTDFPCGNPPSSDSSEFTSEPLARADRKRQALERFQDQTFPASKLSSNQSVEGLNNNKT